MTDELTIPAEKLAALDAVAARMGKDLNRRLPAWCRAFQKVDPETKPLQYVSNVHISMAIATLLEAGIVLSRDEFLRRAAHLYDQTMGNHLMSRNPQ